MLHRRQETMVGDEESLKKRKIKGISIVDISEDLLVEILSRLTVESLMQLRCVCKAWRDFIRRPDFISKHYLMQTTLRNVNLIVSHERSFFSLLSSCSDVDDTLRVTETIKIEDENFLRDLYVMGPCNGLICLAHKSNIHRIFLWNPATREYKHLPLSTVESRPRSEDGTLGFDFDSKNDDFKVLRIPTIRRGGYRGFNCIHQVELYSLKSDSWKQISVVGMIPSNIYVEWSNVYHAGIQYWWAELKYVQMLLSFDFVDEVFELVPYVGARHNIMSTLDLGIFNGSLASSHGELGCKRRGKCFDIGVMTEHQVKDRWVRMIRIGPFPEFKRPLGFWKNSVVFSQSHSLILYDMNTQKLKNVPVASSFPRCDMAVANYVENLVPIKGSRKENDSR
ncbi:F-box and associated interaction domains-containing protein putative isoform 1 [Tripterygium wilfordii]|uniref:F-box and associated interaction domains-containing protein putative isoform 1 n=2 Tax=Tripterygium wilfordii TaxID=458696 RepID=A0A7J7CYK7_TRIWF|nr:F-box and associated interaction domains-containing protein putative isoform 1 [Tripterygium wilfordii]